MFKIQTWSKPDADQYLRSLADACAALEGARLSVGSALPYAFGIETGRHRGGKLARKAGGAQMIGRGWQTVRGQVAGRIAESLKGGEEGVAREIDAIGRDTANAARPFTPVVSGALQRSIRSSFRRR
jgi:hypothetical protein